MKRLISNKKLAILFLSNLTVLFVGGGLFPLLPLFAGEFGATPSIIGLYFAAMYLASVAGTIATGWLASRVSPKILFFSAGILGLVALILMGLATALWQVIVLTSAIWFAGAIVIPLVGVLTGMVTRGENQGKSFSLIYLAHPAGALLGGAATSILVARYGYMTMFFALAAVWSILPIIALLALNDFEKVKESDSAKADHSPVRFGANFYILLLVTLMAAVAISSGRLGTSLSMQALNFSAENVASTAIVSGLFTIPVVLLIGALTDRWGHGPFMLLGYMTTAAGALILSMAVELWHFWLASTLLMIAFGVNLSIASAFVAQNLSAKAQKRGLPLINTMDSVAGIVAFAGAGFVIDAFGPSTLYLATALLAGGAALLLSLLNRERGRKSKAVAATT